MILAGFFLAGGFAVLQSVRVHRLAARVEGGVPDEACGHTLAAHVSDAIVTITEKGVMESANPATERMFGYGARELIGGRVNMLISEPYKSRYDEALRDCLASGDTKRIDSVHEMQGRRKNGAVFPLALMLMIVHIRAGRRVLIVMKNMIHRGHNDTLGASGYRRY